MHVSKSKKSTQTVYIDNCQSFFYCKPGNLRDISSSLYWTPHVNKVTGKAKQRLGFLKRNINSSRKETKTAAYNTIV